MDNESIMSAINDIFRDVLDNSDLALARETTARDVEDWDSLTHVLLVVAIEKRFQVRFTSGEIRAWKNVGDICDALSRRMRQGGE